MQKEKTAKAKWGQHFLRDPRILKKIVDFAHIEPKDTVVEIGPGKGTLTSLLLDRARKVIVIEKDRALVEYLKQNYKSQITNHKLIVVHGDILNIENLLKIVKLKIENYALVGNIPYYITGEIFRKFLESNNPPKSITFVTQKEVALRILAEDGKESVLSISIKAFGTPEYGGVIKAGSFYPKPRVDSAIIAVRQIKKKNEGKKENFFEIVKRGFSHKRKLLKSNLGIGIESALLDECSIPLKARAEELSLEQWFCLVSHLKPSS